MIVKIFTVEINTWFLMILLMKAKKYLKLKKYADVWDRIKNEIKPINGDKENNYEKDYMKIKFNSDNDLPLNKPFMQWQ